MGSQARRVLRAARYNPPVNLPELEAEALKLPVAERARLAEALLESLDELSEEKHRRLWTEEATRRDAELEADPSPGADRPGTSFVTPASGSGDAPGHRSRPSRGRAERSRARRATSTWMAREKGAREVGRWGPT
ncbi:addiction module protein [Sorangium sp. So ce302]|uniref:addiction module protein n=1 Tax=Sorangium sp. So ce302 TaxID=3133297 RepID=UPI003F6145AF